MNYFLCIGVLVSKQRKRHHRNPMIRRLVKTIVSYMGHKRLNVLVTQKIILR